MMQWVVSGFSRTSRIDRRPVDGGKRSWPGGGDAAHPRSAGFPPDTGGRPIVRVRQKLPQEQAQADLVAPVAATGAAGFDHTRVRQMGFGVAGDIHDASALEREAVRHTNVSYRIGMTTARREHHESVRNHCASSSNTCRPAAMAASVSKH
jgi:hypothetical protein